MKKNTKKYIEKNNKTNQNLVEHNLVYSYDFIKSFLIQAKNNSQLVIQFPQKIISIPPNSLRQKKVNLNEYDSPMRQVADEKYIVFKKLLSQKSENGGWLTLSKSHSIQENRQEENELIFNLNIITPNNFESVAAAIYGIVGDDQKKTIKLTQILISKSEFESKYHQIYSRLCSHIQQKFNSRQLKMEINKHLQQSLLYIDRAVCDDKKLRKEFFNKIIFFSELFLNNIIYREIFDRLVLGYLRNFFTYKNRPEYLESLIIIFDKVGRFELTHHEQYQKKPTNVHRMIKNINQYTQISFESMFQLFEIVKENEKVDNRLRSLIKNLLQKRTNKWKQTFLDSEKPKTLQQIKLESQNSIQSMTQKSNKQEDCFPSLQIEITKNLKNLNEQILIELALKDEQIFTDTFIINFYQHKMDLIDKLINLCHSFIYHKFIFLETLVHSLQMKFQLIALDQADFPFLKKSLVKLLLPFIKNNQFNIQSLKEIASSQEQEELIADLQIMINKTIN